MTEISQETLLQERIWAHPADKLYSIQYWTGLKWDYYYSTTLECKVVGWEQVLEQFNFANPPVRIVRVSRYLVDGELVITEVNKIRIK